MARFGQGLNPQLTAVDYSPIMQGTQIAAQGIQQGGQNIGNALAGLGQQIGSGLQQRAEYKAQIKAGNDAIKAISGLKNIPPEIQAMAQQAQQRLQDPNLSLVEQAKIGAQVNQLFGGVMQSGIQTMMQQQAQAADKQAMNVAIAAMKSGNMDPLSAVQAMGMQVSPAVANFVADYQQSQAQTGKLRAETAALAAKAENPLDVLYKKAQIAKLNAEATASGQQKAPEGYRYTATGTLEAIPGGPAEIAQTKAQREDYLAQQKEIQSSEKYLSRAGGMMDDLNRQFQLLEQAETLSMRHAGGAIAGLPVIRDINAAQPIPGASDAKILNSVYNSLRSGERIRKMQELKENSPTGATGFGNQSDKEGAALEQTYTEFDVSLPEEEQLRRIQDAKKRINRLRFALADDIRKVGGAAKQEIRYDIQGRAWTKDANGNVVPYNG